MSTYYRSKNGINGNIYKIGKDNYWLIYNHFTKQWCYSSLGSLSLSLLSTFEEIKDKKELFLALL